MKSIGTAFHFQGVVPADSDSFDFTFKTGKGKDDFVFSLKIYPEVASYMQLISDRHWHSNVRGCPLLKGSAFDMFLVLGNEGYVVYYNGLRSCMLQDKIRMERVTTLNIDGNVTVNSIGVVSDWSKSAFGNHSGTSRWELSKNQSDGPQPVSKPNQPYLGQIPGGLKIGLAFFFQGVVPSDASGFEINYKTGPNDGDAIAYQFKPALHAVHEMFVRGMVFGKGEAIDIIIIITGDSYEVAVNGHFFTRSDHHIPVEKVSTLQICGDVLINTCAIIHVDKFNLTCDLSAHF
ncbi:hypothetical protein AMELA_G00155100 [Ameiurus melas]|uniref:Galectin n=1 Tax=Ameiurus melas TaxID=219545 RepID=A0A7J6AIT2_AMEME|nr:hypothetical protein AMELA_G00155100 [Ameiurus melas]